MHLVSYICLPVFSCKLSGGMGELRIRVGSQVVYRDKELVDRHFEPVVLLEGLCIWFKELYCQAQGVVRVFVEGLGASKF